MSESDILPEAPRKRFSSLSRSTVKRKYEEKAGPIIGPLPLAWTALILHLSLIGGVAAIEIELCLWRERCREWLATHRRYFAINYLERAPDGKQWSIYLPDAQPCVAGDYDAALIAAVQAVGKEKT